MNILNITGRLMSYRIKKQVTDIRLCKGGLSFVVCPKCGNCIDKEYIKFCSCCGQHLGWKFFKIQE